MFQFSLLTEISICKKPVPVIDFPKKSSDPDEIAQSQFDRRVITAPYDGIISVVDANHGEWTRPDEMMVEVLDTARWRIETKNVGELQIGLVAFGQKVQVKANAFKSEILVD